ncbi:unnamed protein product [Ilex paraguariensis]|uniref:Uncharacterized protein n=1 Tax=Ilex paraguariensis TaxID=185542 RepID=A0ABC8TQT9_9AQUA
MEGTLPGNSTIPGCCCKLKTLKESFKVKSWELGDISDRAREAIEALENCQSGLVTDPLNNTLRLEERQLLATTQ